MSMLCLVQCDAPQCESKSSVQIKGERCIDELVTMRPPEWIELVAANCLLFCSWGCVALYATEHEAALAKATAEGNYKAQVELLTAEKNAALEAVKEEKRERERDALKIRREAAAAKFKLPAFARDVLKGNTTEELELDAAAKRKEMEAAGVGPATGTGPAIPGRAKASDNGGDKAEQDLTAQAMKRSPIFL